jgi:hypothetical protein
MYMPADIYFFRNKGAVNTFWFETIVAGEFIYCIFRPFSNFNAENQQIVSGFGPSQNT